MKDKEKVLKLLASCMLVIIISILISNIVTAQSRELISITQSTMSGADVSGYFGTQKGHILNENAKNNGTFTKEADVKIEGSSAVFIYENYSQNNTEPIQDYLWDGWNSENFKEKYADSINEYETEWMENERKKNFTGYIDKTDIHANDEINVYFTSEPDKDSVTVTNGTIQEIKNVDFEKNDTKYTCLYVIKADEELTGNIVITAKSTYQKYNVTYTPYVNTSIIKSDKTGKVGDAQDLALFSAVEKSSSTATVSLTGITINEVADTGVANTGAAVEADDYKPKWGIDKNQQDNRDDAKDPTRTSGSTRYNKIVDDFYRHYIKNVEIRMYVWGVGDNQTDLENLKNITLDTVGESQNVVNVVNEDNEQQLGERGNGKYLAVSGGNTSETADEAYDSPYANNRKRDKPVIVERGSWVLFAVDVVNDISENNEDIQGKDKENVKKQFENINKVLVQAQFELSPIFTEVKMCQSDKNGRPKGFNGPSLTKDGDKNNKIKFYSDGSFDNAGGDTECSQDSFFNVGNNGWIDIEKKGLTRYWIAARVGGNLTRTNETNYVDYASDLDLPLASRAIITKLAMPGFDWSKTNVRNYIEDIKGNTQYKEETNEKNGNKLTDGELTTRIQNIPKIGDQYCVYLNEYEKTANLDGALYIGRKIDNEIKHMPRR